MKRKTWRKSIAVLLVIAMMMTIMPMAAFAADEEIESEVTYIFADEVEVGATTVQFVYEDEEDGYIPVKGVTATEGVEIDVTVLLNGVPDTDNVADITCDPEEVVTFEEGKLIAVAAGEATVTAAYADETATLNVKVVEAAKEDNDKSVSGTQAGDVPGAKEIEWEVSQSKTTEKSVLTAEDSYKTNVTLSLPAKDEKLQSAVVFVLDNSDSAKKGATGCVEALREELQNVSEEANVKVAVVKFKGKAISGGWHDLNDSAIEDDIDAKISTGTNIHAGLLEAQRLLGMDDVKDIPKERTYVILVSDGITYLFSDAIGEPLTIGTAIYSQGQIAESYPYQINYDNECMKLKWGTFNIGFSEMAENGEQDASKAVEVYLASLNVNENFFVPFETYRKNPGEGNYDIINNTIVHFEENSSDEYKSAALNFLNEHEYSYAVEAHNTANNVDVAFLKAAQTWGSLCEADENGKRYNCYAVKCADTYPYGTDFMNYLSGVAGTSNTIDFTEISKDIAYVIESGTVTDYMGYGNDDHGNNYDFDFVDPENMILTVGNETYTATTMGELQWGFNGTVEDGFDYVVTYVPGEKKADEHFVWEINVPVSEFVPVSLTYTVQLMNPQTSVETTTTFKNLFTNGVTRLDYTGYSGDGKVEFKVEPVEYTVTVVPQPTPGGNEGNFDGTTDETTIIPDPQTPQAQPPVVNPPVVEEITEPNVPQTDVPVIEVPGEPIEEPPVPLGDAPATGDSNNPMAFALALMAAGLGLVITRRKFN